MVACSEQRNERVEHRDYFGAHLVHVAQRDDVDEVIATDVADESLFAAHPLHDVVQNLRENANDAIALVVRVAIVEFLEVIQIRVARREQHIARKPAPDFTSGGSYYLAPADFATIYDLGPLYQQSMNGSGQSVAIVARSNINIADVRQFRTSFGLPANDPQIIVNGSDPGIFSSGEETEADLDVEWSGAVARNATIKFVVSMSTNSSEVGMVFCGFTSTDRRSSRSSGTGTTPTFGSMVQKG